MYFEFRRQGLLLVYDALLFTQASSCIPSEFIILSNASHPKTRYFFGSSTVLPWNEQRVMIS